MLTIHLLIAFIGGCFSGFISGLLGGGSGLINIPMLHYLLTVDKIPTQYTLKIAIGTSLSAGILSMAVATYVQHRKKMMHWGLFKQLFLPSVLGIVVGVMITNFLPSKLLHWIFGISLLGMGLWYYIRRESRQHFWSPNPWVLRAGGFFVAISVGLLGMGILTIPFLRKCGVSLLQSIAVTVALGILTSVLGTLVFIYAGWGKGFPLSCLGFIEWRYALICGLGAALLASLGAHCAHRISPRWLHILFCSLLVIIGLKMIF